MTKSKVKGKINSQSKAIFMWILTTAEWENPQHQFCLNSWGGAFQFFLWYSEFIKKFTKCQEKAYWHFITTYNIEPFSKEVSFFLQLIIPVLPIYIKYTYIFYIYTHTHPQRERESTEGLTCMNICSKLHLLLLFQSMSRQGIKQAWVNVCVCVHLILLECGHKLLQGDVLLFQLSVVLQQSGLSELVLLYLLSHPALLQLQHFITLQHTVEKRTTNISERKWSKEERFFYFRFLSLRLTVMDHLCIIFTQGCTLTCNWSSEGRRWRKTASVPIIMHTYPRVFQLL